MDQEALTKSFSNYIFTAIGGFVFGIFVSSFIFISPLVSTLILIIGLGTFFAEKIDKNSFSQEIIFVVLICVSFGLGCLRYSIKDFHNQLEPTLQGIVVGEPEQKDDSTRFVFKSDNGEKALVSAGLYENVSYGDKVSLSGRFKTPSLIEGTGDKRNFDYAAYLSKDDIYYTMSFAKVEVVASGFGNDLKELLYKVKYNFIGHIKFILAEPYSSLLSGLLISGREAMPSAILEEFRRAGIIHIVVLSGYNVTIIADFLRRVFEKVLLLTRFTSVPALASGVSILGILAFVILTGGQATVVRASLMVLAVITAKMLGRNYSAWRALFTAGFVMLLQNPKILVFDPSFQLSFLATLALIYVAPVVEKYLSVGFLKNKHELRSTLSTTIATQITVLPLLVYSIGDISLVSLPVNILVLMIIPFTMLVGFIAVLVSYVSAFLAVPIAYITHLLLSWIFLVSGFFGNLKFATISVANLSVWIVVLIYAVLIAILWRGRSSPHSSAS